MKETEYRRSEAIDFLRVVLCFLIVWNHTSNNILHGFLNPLSLAGGIGNQGFFFMSGYLYSNADILFPYQWLKKRIWKIVKPYWIVSRHLRCTNFRQQCTREKFRKTDISVQRRLNYKLFVKCWYTVDDRFWYTLSVRLHGFISRSSFL